MSSSVSCRSPVLSRALGIKTSRVIRGSKRQKAGRLTQFKQLDSSEVAPTPQPSQTQLIWEHGNWREQTISLAPSSMRLCFTPCKKHSCGMTQGMLGKRWPSQPLPKPLIAPSRCATQVTIGYIGKKTLKRKSMTCQQNRVHWIKNECKVTQGEPQPQLHAQCRKILNRSRKKSTNLIYDEMTLWRHSFLRQKSMVLRSSQTLWSKDCRFCCLLSSLSGWNSVSRFPNIQLNGTGQERIPQQKKYLGGSCWGSWRPPKLLKTRKGCESTVQIPIQVDHLLITNVVLLCADIMILDIDTLIFYDDIMLILWHCVTRCIRFPFLSPTFKHLQGPQNVMLIFCAEFCVYGEDSPDQVASGSRRNCGNTSKALIMGSKHQPATLPKRPAQEHQPTISSCSLIRFGFSHQSLEFSWPFLHRMVVWS